MTKKRYEDYKFKVGDRVRIKNGDCAKTIGKLPKKLIGTLTTIAKVKCDSYYPYQVEMEGVFEDTGIWQFAEDEIERQKIKATNLARKMYPDAEEEDGWLIL